MNAVAERAVCYACGEKWPVPLLDLRYILVTKEGVTRVFCGKHRSNVTARARLFTMEDMKWLKREGMCLP